MMRGGLLLRTTIVAGAVLLTASLSNAQDATKQSGQEASSTRQQKATAKPHKVWTDDDLGSLHRSSGVTVAQAHPESEMPKAPAGEESTPIAGAKKPEGNKNPTGAAVLSHPKTADDADKMIAWEQRDIDSQQEYVDKVQQQLDQAPADQKEHLQKVLAERQQILADVRREQQQLIAERKLLQKKSSGDTSASSQSPQ